MWKIVNKNRPHSSDTRTTSIAPDDFNLDFTNVATRLVDNLPSSDKKRILI